MKMNEAVRNVGSNKSVDETPLLTQPHDPQARRARAFARGENRADYQDFGVHPHWLGEQRGALST